MSSRRAPVRIVAALFVAVAVSLLGFRLFLPGAASACAPAGSACCCDSGAPASGESPESGGCGCSVSPAAPVPSATLASAEALPLPVVSAEAPEALPFGAPARAPSAGGPVPRARSAPTQALLTTFRN